MKVVIAISAILCWTSVSVASICFSADEVDTFASDITSAPATQAADGGITMAATATSAASGAAVNSGPALLLASQSIGVAGSAGTSNGISSGGLGGGGGGSKGGPGPDGLPEASADEDNGEVAAAEAGAVEAGAVSMPEPSTAVVWGVLLVCGFGVARLRRK